MRIFLSLLLILSAFAASGQNLRDEKSRYTPYFLSEIRSIGETLEFNPRGVKDEMETRLREFYLSDPSDRKIHQRQILSTSDNDIYRREWNINLQRLFMHDILNTQEETFLIQEASNIFEMHRTLARAYIKLNEPYQAAWNYSMALRYRTLRFSPDVFTNEDRLSLDDTSAQQNADASAYSDADKKRIEATRIESEVRSLYQAALDNQNLPPSSAARRFSVTEINERKNASEQATGARRTAETEFIKEEEKFREYEKQYNADSAAVLVEIAELVRSIEESIKEREKVLNRKTIYKTSFNQTLVHDYAENRQFRAYANLLESAAALDPSRGDIRIKLAEEYESSRLTEKAIFHYEEFLKNPPAQRTDEDKTRELAASRALGALYYQQKRYPDSAWHYEQAFLLTPQGVNRDFLQFQLASIHAKNTGNYERSIDLFEDLLSRLNSANPTEPPQRMEWLEKKFHSYNYLYTMHLKRSEKTKALESLKSAVDAENELNTLIESQRAELARLHKSIQEAKKPLMEDTRQRDLSELLRLEREETLAREFLGTLHTAYKSLPLSNVYFAYARQLEEQHAIREAVLVYRNAERKGIAPDAARREMERLKKMYAIEY